MSMMLILVGILISGDPAFEKFYGDMDVRFSHHRVLIFLALTGKNILWISGA